MTVNQSAQNRATGSESIVAIPATRGDRLARIIEDPFASAIAASLVTLSALTIVVTGSWLISVVLN